jgi:hypothetical protein
MSSVAPPVRVPLTGLATATLAVALLVVFALGAIVGHKAAACDVLVERPQPADWQSWPVIALGSEYFVHWRQTSGIEVHTAEICPGGGLWLPAASLPAPFDTFRNRPWLVRLRRKEDVFVACVDQVFLLAFELRVGTTPFGARIASLLVFWLLLLFGAGGFAARAVARSLAYAPTADTADGPDRESPPTYASVVPAGDSDPRVIAARGVARAWLRAVLWPSLTLIIVIVCGAGCYAVAADLTKGVGRMIK